jgi:hypothetical protein
MLLRYIIALILIISTTNGVELLIGSFNIQIFGTTKAGRPAIMDILTKVATR